MCNIYLIDMIEGTFFLKECEEEFKLIPKSYYNNEFLAKSPLEAIDFFKKYCKNSEIIVGKNVYERLKFIEVQFSINKKLLDNFNKVKKNIMEYQGKFKIV